jgi:hypothetical protein
VTRWTRRMLLVAVAVLVPALAGCEAGDGAPTLMFHPAANGGTASAGGVAVDNAFVLGPALNAVLRPGGRAGVFLALYAQNGDKLLSVTAPGTAKSVQIIGGTVALPPDTLVPLTGPAPRIVLSGLTTSLSGGQTIQLVLDFANAGQLSVLVPVEPDAYDYATYSPPPKPSPTPAHKVRPKASASATPTPSPTS